VKELLAPFERTSPGESKEDISGYIDLSPENDGIDRENKDTL
jgi:hypothetical protein